MTQLRKRDKRVRELVVHVSCMNEDTYDKVMDEIACLLEDMDRAELEGIIAEAWGNDKRAS